MARDPLNTLIAETDEAAPTKDVLLAVSGALRGDRKGVQVLVKKARSRIEKRISRELRSIARDKPATKKNKPKIRGARLSPPSRPPPMAPPGPVHVRLPDGRRVRLELHPAVARHRDLSTLTRVSRSNTKRAFAAIDHNGRAIDRLAATQQELADRLAKLQSNGDLALLRGLVEGLVNLERRVEKARDVQGKALAAQKRSVQKQFARQAQTVAAQNQAAQIQKLHGAIATLQSAAFGTKGSLLAPNNIRLAANQLGWSFGPQILETLGLAESGTTSPLAWLAPLASLGTSQAVLGRRQHERYVSGVVTDSQFELVGIPAAFLVLFTLSMSFARTRASLPAPAGTSGRLVYESNRISLRSYIAEAEWEDFARRETVPVTTQVLEPAHGPGISSTGAVRNGELTIQVRIEYGDGIPLPDALAVSWTVDTRKPDG